MVVLLYVLSAEFNWLVFMPEYELLAEVGTSPTPAFKPEYVLLTVYGSNPIYYFLPFETVSLIEWGFSPVIGILDGLLELTVLGFRN